MKLARVIPLVGALFVLPSCAATPPKPRLVVLVVVDGLSYPQLARMQPQLSPRGAFAQLANSGASFVNARHRHAFTETAVGHATLLTGAYPCLNGIVGNELFDRVTGKWHAAVFDPDWPLVGAPTPTPATTPDTSPATQEDDGASPANLLVPTVGDTLKLVTSGKARVFGVSVKDRAAILLAGHAADGAYWFNAREGVWITSEYYRTVLPDYLKAFNGRGLGRAYAGRSWTLSAKPDNYVRYYPDDAPYEAVKPLTAGFPHRIFRHGEKGYASTLMASPFMDELTIQAARLIVANESLGADDVPDLLAINLSSNDYVSHAFGPYSLEAQDVLIRVDRLLAGLMAFLDKQVKGGRYTFVVTGDHGFGPVPEFLTESRVPAGRSPLPKPELLRDLMEMALVEHLGPADDGRFYVEEVASDEVYLNGDIPELAGDKFLAAQRIVRDFLLTRPGVSVAFTRETLLTADPESEGLLGQFCRTFNPRRSGDVLFALLPGYVQGRTPATHGNPWRFNTHVPLLIRSPGLPHGRFTRRVCPADIAPTLSRLLGVPQPTGCMTEPLCEVVGD